MTVKTMFDANDLSDYLKEVAGTDPKVVPLERNAWVKVGSFKIFLLEIIHGLDHSRIKILVGRHRSVTDDAVVKDGPVVAKCCYEIPGTNLYFELFADRDTSEIIPLVVEKGFGVTTIEDFMGIATNLPDSALEKVAKAIISKQVVWDQGKSSLVAEASSGEFKFESSLYSFDEISESPSGLFLIKGSLQYIGEFLEDLEIERLSLLDQHRYSEAERVYKKIVSLNKLLRTA